MMLKSQQPNSVMLLIHPQGGQQLLTVDALERLTTDGGQMPFAHRLKFALADCLVVTMQWSNHPDRSIAYRLEERPSGLVFVFVTDHENQDAVPARLATHLRGGRFAGDGYAVHAAEV